MGKRKIKVKKHTRKRNGKKQEVRMHSRKIERNDHRYYLRIGQINFLILKILKMMHGKITISRE